ncbi:protein root UVB sensitive 5 isoform X2 [Asparagus officinalis]|uniref:protein root UVB sensitive 5 isoform X2 n=1 Tax=Asparagus officinalis TaxID=4686 RepID=UPI00098DF788|nr:protein root UVB sensitive 5 isoform X2 [Asparagus officinalis]
MALGLPLLRVPYGPRAPLSVTSSSSSHRRRRQRICVEIKSQPQPQEEPPDDDDDGDKQQKQKQNIDRSPPQHLLMERYILDTNSELQATWEEHGAVQKDNFSDLAWLPLVIREFILPAGFPGSVSDDYLGYMLLQFPTNVTGWICHALVTSSLLKAVGIGSFTAAAIRWVSKDGLGAIGRLFIGGRFGKLFDDDPKQWRMYADFIGSTGSIFELSTQLYPAYFLPLASLGNLAKAVARGLKDPSFRVIQNHFAITGNLGEVAAKEEVWEVTAQLLGLAIGILIMDTPVIQTSYAKLTITWFSLRILHLWLRYQSLSVLRFRTINLKRARLLVKSHVMHQMVPGFIECNKEETILSWERFLQPRVIYGVSIEKMIGTEGSSNTVKALLKLYANQKYVLFVKQKGSGPAEYSVTFKVGATSLSVLKSLWHVHWLHENPNEEATCILSRLGESLQKLEKGFPEFLQQLERAGWKKHQIILNVPKNILFHEVELSMNLDDNVDEL